MKTTVDTSDGLLREIRRLARREGTTLRAPAEGRTAWAIPWPRVHGFFSIATHPRPPFAAGGERVSPPRAG
ncbi:hypothetical protein GCM10010466_52260 [Planomonospora alba]|uniref:Uncharacterized protein n=1 Tax=Planomonospora alba TaxID=161354 RepID=A0ABP6NPQ0_9ACTN